MRILVIFLGYGRPSKVSIAKSGGDVHFMEVCRRWSKGDHKILMLTTEAGFQLCKTEGLELESKIISVPFDERLHNSAVGAAACHLLRIAKALKYVRRVDSFDVVCAVSHCLPDVAIAYIASKRVPKSKAVVYLHHLTLSPRQRIRYHPWLASILGWVSQSISLSLIKRGGFRIFTYQHLEEQLTRKGFSRRRRKYISNGINSIYAKKIQPDLQGFDAFFLARISPMKGVLDLVNIWKRVCNVMPGGKLGIAGEGAPQYVDELKRRIEKAKLEKNVVLLGAVSEERKFALLKSSKLFIFPSYEEGWGIAICEAMACALPVVAYDLPAYRVPFGSQGLVVVPIGDVKRFADEAVALLQNEEKRRHLAIQAETLVSKYDWDSIAYRELIYLIEITEGRA